MPTAPLHAILFDLDGTLLDTHDLILASFRHATSTVLNTRIPNEQLVARVGVPLASQMADFTANPVTQQELLAAYRAHNARFHDAMVKEFPEVAPTVAELGRRGLKLAVVTSKRRDVALRGLRLFGLDTAFAFVIGSDDCTRHKPDPEPVLQACGRLGLDPIACAYVGDSPFDLQATRAAGVTSVAATWGMFPEQILRAEHPDIVCHAPHELLDLTPR